MVQSFFTGGGSPAAISPLTATNARFTAMRAQNGQRFIRRKSLRDGAQIELHSGKFQCAVPFRSTRFRHPTPRQRFAIREICPAATNASLDRW